MQRVPVGRERGPEGTPHEEDPKAVGRRQEMKRADGKQRRAI